MAKNKCGTRPVMMAEVREERKATTNVTIYFTCLTARNVSITALAQQVQQSLFTLHKTYLFTIGSNDIDRQVRMV